MHLFTHLPDNALEQKRVVGVKGKEEEYIYHVDIVWIRNLSDKEHFPLPATPNTVGAK